MRALSVLTLLAAVLLTAPLSASADSRSAGPFVGLWITRFDYRTESDVREAIGRSADLGVTDIFWQVRGQADAFYPSDLEPWGRELFRDLPADATSPGFDPLAAALTEARARGVRLHAWVNIMPLWKGKSPPADGTSVRHPFNAHPEWRLRNAAGEPQPLNDHYVIVNPLLPAVHDHIVAVCRDIVTRYPVDGLHMDYVRFVSDTMKDPAAFPGDSESIGLFEKATGTTWSDTPECEAAFRAFKRQRISDLVRRIKTEAVNRRPGCVLTAAIWRRPDLAVDTYLQDAPAWLKDGTLDRGLPMLYTSDNRQYEDDLTAWLAAAPGKAISPGLGIYLHDPDAPAGGSTRWQLDESDRVKSEGFALFAYASMYESADPNQNKSPKAVAERAARLALVRGEIARRRPAAATP